MKGIDIVRTSTGRSLTYYLFPDTAAALAFCAQYSVDLNTVAFYHR